MKLLQTILKNKNQQIRKPYGYEPIPAVRDFHENIDNIISEWKIYVNSTTSHGKPIDELSAEQKHLNEDKKWKAFFIFIYGEFNPEALLYFPKTAALAEKWKKQVKLVFFSNLEPGKHLPAHTGNNHAVIRAQIGVDILQPESTGLRVEEKTVKLKNGELFIFDDTFEHEAWNDGQHVRTVLIIDYVKPFPFFYDLLNRKTLNKVKESGYVQKALAKLKNQNTKK